MICAQCYLSRHCVVKALGCKELAQSGEYSELVQETQAQIYCANINASVGCCPNLFLENLAFVMVDKKSLDHGWCQC